MKKLEFYHSIYNAEETNTVANQLLLSIEGSSLSDVMLQMASEALKTSNDKLTKVLHSQRTNPYTLSLKFKDSWRDETHIGGRDAIDAMTHWVFDAEIQEAAKRLIKIFERHGWSLQSYGYQRQSSAVNSLITEMKKPENQTDLTTCNMMRWFEEEVKAQADFETTFNEKAGHEGRKELISKRDLHIQVNDDIEGLVSYLNGVILFKKNDKEFVSLYKEFEGIIKEAASVARKRRTRRKNEDEENQDS